MGASAIDGQTYSKKTALIYTFNLIVGMGALALPLGFHEAGIILGVIFLACVGTLSYITASWIIESQAAANALLFVESATEESRDVATPLLSDSKFTINSTHHMYDDRRFEITQRTEISHMAKLFLGVWGQRVFYFFLIIYLYGDLAIYAAVVSDSLSTAIGGFIVKDNTVSDDNAYYLYLMIFSIVVVPFSMFNFQKTKYLQIATLVSRNVAFFLMIILAFIFIANGRGASTHELKWFDITKLPALFGASIYAFMCHHSLPSIITPIDNKKGVRGLLLMDFGLVWIAYTMLCLSANFAFGAVTTPTCKKAHNSDFEPCEIQSLYTLNFASYNVRVLAGYLSLFPVFTLTTNFPLIAITLRNNLLLLLPGKSKSRLMQIVFSLVATLPPIAIAFATKNISLLVSITGSYAGLAIQLVIPAVLVYKARKVMRSTFGAAVKNPYGSYFVNVIWVYAILAISVVCLCLITFNHIYTRK